MGEQSTLLLCRFLAKDKSTFYELVESLTDITAIGCRSLEITEAILAWVIFDALRLDLPHFGQVWLVPDQHDGDSSIGIILELSQPFLHVFKGLALGNIESNDGSNSPTIVCIGDGSETLLACGIPDLILDGLALDKCGFGGELDSNGGLRVHIEGVIDKAR